jgi:hypothetical protein
MAQDDVMRKYVEEYAAAGDYRAVALLRRLIEIRKALDEALVEADRYQPLRRRVSDIRNDLGSFFSGLAQMEERRERSL